ncbi:MAG: FAD-dependent oxidoreductase [Deltaproteobacteria bacterium]|nr:FAD-dependent oxidoreductase [Deltaproteobacteria bacterium]
MSEQFKYLFSPFKIGPVTVKNRIVSSAHGTMFADSDNILDDRYVEYQRVRAKGGAGLIIAGMMNVMFNSRDLTFIHEVYDPKCVPMLKKLADGVHQEDGKVFVQLCHAGRETDIELTRQPTWAPSPIPSPAIFRAVPKEMELEDIQEVVKAFGKAAGFCKEAGLDGVELHAGSGYLLEEFMSPHSNRRTDEYGGSMENRMRFPMEVIEAVRDAVGEDMALGIRIPLDEMVPDGNGPEEMKEIARMLEDTGEIDYILIGVPFYEVLLSLGCGMQVPLGFFNSWSAQLKETVDLPIMANTRINDPVQAEKVVADGHGDLVAMTRALICDPELPNKAREGKFDEIRLCIACDQGCLGRAFKSHPITCLQNAVVGKEKEIGTLEPAKTRKNIVVIGGGPAGMEAARVARLRGHKVVLYEKENELGGQVNLAAKVPSRTEFGSCARYLIKQMEILGVEVNLGVEVTPEMIEQENPDAVIVAAGSSPVMPPMPGFDQDNVVNIRDVLAGTAEIGERVVVADGGEGHWQCVSTAEYLAESGKKVEIVTPLMMVGMDIATTSDLPAAYVRLRAKDVVFTPNMAVTGISGNVVELFDVYANAQKTIEGVDTLVLAMGSYANDSLYKSLKGKVKEIHRVGDCLAPRLALDAIYDGYNAGRVI